MTVPARLFGIQKADGSIDQDPHNITSDGTTRALASRGESCVEVEIVRKGTVAELREDFRRRIEGAIAHGCNCRVDAERATIVARLEAIVYWLEINGQDESFPGHELSALLSDLKAGRVEGKT